MSGGKSLASYLQEVARAWNEYNANVLATLISIEDDDHTTIVRQFQGEPADVVEKLLDEDIDDIILDHLRVLSEIAKGDFTQAYECQKSVVTNFNKLLSSTKDDNWPLPMMYTICLDLRRIAAQADVQQVDKGAKPGAMLEKAAELMMNCFRTCALDSKSAEDVTKRWGMLNIVNQLFKIYFKVNKMHLCKPLIRAIESSPLKERYSKAQLITYKFFVGRKHMFDNAFKAAEEYLRFAFEHCHAASTKNKRSILIYLIPVKMLLGQMPKEELLHKYNLLQFKDVVRSVKEGHLLKLNEALEENEKFFISCGIFLILEKLKIITYRNLFKKVTLVMRTHQIPVDAFLVVLKMMNVEDIDKDETQCIVANLIYEGKIKGYISYQHQKLVVSKQQPFPPLSATSW